MSETHLGKLDQKENSDAQYLSVRKLELDVTPADVKALNKAGQDDVEKNRAVENLPNMEIRDYNKDFSLGVPPGEKLSLEQISQKNPELGRHINALAGNAMVGSFSNRRIHTQCSHRDGVKVRPGPSGEHVEDAGGLAA